MFLMLKYDHQLSEVKSRFPAASRILIVLPQNLNTDNLAAGLALYLSLKSTGKKVDIVSTGTPLVANSNLYGIGEVKNDVSKAGAGNFIISLDGVVDNTGTMQTVPALEKLDWYPEGSKLNLVFHVVPGQRFEPTNIETRHEEAGYDLTWVIGTQSLNELGNLFIANSQYFAQGQVINIDNNSQNSYFGFANIVDPNASSLSEIVAQVLPSLTLTMDKDEASNILTGIYAATNNLTQKINPDTFMVVSQAVQVGGALPNGSQSPSDQASQVPQSEPVSQPQPAFAPQPDPVASSAPQASDPVQQPSVPVVDSTTQPQPSLQGSPFIVPPQDINIPMPAYQPEPVKPQVPQQTVPQFQFSQTQQDGQIQSAPAIPQGNSQGFDLRQIFQVPQMPSAAQANNNQQAVTDSVPTVEQIYQPSGSHYEHEPIPQPDITKASQEERPQGEAVHTSNPEMESTPTPDWLVPKIFKGGNLG